MAIQNVGTRDLDEGELRTAEETNAVSESFRISHEHRFGYSALHIFCEINHVIRCLANVAQPDPTGRSRASSSFPAAPPRHVPVTSTNVASDDLDEGSRAV